MYGFSYKLSAFFSTGTKPKYGFRMNGVKYQLLRESEGPTLTLKCSGGGATVAATNTLIIVGESLVSCCISPLT
jgi:Profilin